MKKEWKEKWVAALRSGKDVARNLMGLNDIFRFTFEEIADVIEEQF